MHETIIITIIIIIKNEKIRVTLCENAAGALHNSQLCSRPTLINVYLFDFFQPKHVYSMGNIDKQNSIIEENCQLTV